MVVPCEVTKYPIIFLAKLLLSDSSLRLCLYLIVLMGINFDVSVGIKISLGDLIEVRIGDKGVRTDEESSDLLPFQGFTSGL